jgi:phospholipid/cholesterol/gamma-HCH transport system permease protein
MLISSTQLGVSGYDYFFKSFEIIQYRDLMGGLLKAVVFGLIIGNVGCYYGMTTSGGTQGVGNATTKSVVTASVMVVSFDFIMTKGMWLVEAYARGGAAQ